MFADATTIFETVTTTPLNLDWRTRQYPKILDYGEVDHDCEPWSSRNPTNPFPSLQVQLVSD